MPVSEPQQAVILKNLFGPGANLGALPWRPFRTGVEIYQIYGDLRSGPSAALLRYQPGATVPKHRHTGYEHIIVLVSSQEDEHGESKAGTLIVNPPGSTHSIRSENGCVVLAIWERPVSFEVGTE